MAKHKSNAEQRLRQQKTYYTQQIKQLKEDANQRLMDFEHNLHQQLYAQHFYAEALLNLLYHDESPSSESVMGAMTLQRSLRDAGQQLSDDLADYRIQLCH